MKTFEAWTNKKRNKFEYEEITDGEKIDIDDFIDDIKKYDEEFAECDEDESKNWCVSTYLLDGISDDFPYYVWEKSPECPYKRVYREEEKGDGHDESTTIGIFMRKHDKKYFLLWIHDAGFIGPSTLSMADHLIEVEVSMNGQGMFENMKNFKEFINEDIQEELERAHRNKSLERIEMERANRCVIYLKDDQDNISQVAEVENIVDASNPQLGVFMLMSNFVDATPYYCWVPRGFNFDLGDHANYLIEFGIKLNMSEPIKKPEKIKGLFEK